MKKIILITIFIVCVVFLVSCSEYDKNYVYDGESLIGVWQERDLDEDFYKIYEFKADGTVTQTCYTQGIVNDVSLTGEVLSFCHTLKSDKYVPGVLPLLTRKLAPSSLIANPTAAPPWKK